MEYIKNFINSTAFKRFCWNTLNGFIGVLIMYLSGLELAEASFVVPVLIATLNGITKELNKK